MQYKKGGLILQQYHCENLISRNARDVCFYLFQKPSLKISVVASAVLLCSAKDIFYV